MNADMFGYLLAALLRLDPLADVGRQVCLAVADYLSCQLSNLDR